MGDLLPSLESIQAALAWAFNNPATAVAVLVVGRKLYRKAEAIEARLAAREKAEAAREAALIDAVKRVEHATSAVVGTHKLTRAVIQRYRRDLGEPDGEIREETA